MYGACGESKWDSWIIVEVMTLIFFLLECGYCGTIGKFAVWSVMCVCFEVIVI